MEKRKPGRPPIIGLERKWNHTVHVENSIWRLVEQQADKEERSTSSIMRDLIINHFKKD